VKKWPYRVIPENPAAWLIQVAKNRALDVLRREVSLREKSDELVRAFAWQEALGNQRHEAGRHDEALDDEHQ
jgi:RNA polymerase sigma-70 factor (ECF subfamily)